MPDWKPHIRARLASLRLSPSREAEIVEELAQHLDDRWRELVARGATPEEAAHLARTEFDGARLEALLGTLRQAHWRETPPPGPARAFSFDSVLIDLRHAIRALRATPSFTLGALLVLALGTGATTAIFSVVDAVALRPLPFPDPDRIVAVGVRADAAVGGAGDPAVGARAPVGRRRSHARRQAARAGRPDERHVSGLPGLGGSATGLRVDGGHQRHRRLRPSTSGRRTGARERPACHGELLRRAARAAHAGCGLYVSE